MLKHNLLIIFRNIKRNKNSFFINLIGLSTGLACALLIYLWVNDELHVDKFLKNDGQLFQVMQNSELMNSVTTSEMTPGLLAESLAEEMPEVEYSVSLRYGGTPILSDNDKNIKAKCIYAGKDFFNVFSFNLSEGNAGQVLADQNSIVISKELSLKLFNTTKNVNGKTIELDHDKKFFISGIFNDVPSNSSLQFDFVLPLKVDRSSSFYDWGNQNFYTYVILKQGTSVKQFNSKVAGLIQLKGGKSYRTLFLSPYSEKYLYGTYENGKQAGGRIEYVKLFSIIAVFILVIACINFTNLSTARASRRMKEIGMKKALGADRKTLIIQHLVESVSMAVLSLTIAILLVWLFLHQFNEITEKQITLNPNASIILSILSITLLTGLIAGSYPALYLSGFNPAAVLKGKFNSSIGEQWTRKGLVVFQFVVSSIFIVSVLIVYKQTEFIQTKNLGYNKDNIIYFASEGKLGENRDVFLSEIKNIPGVVNASAAGSNIIGSHSTTSDINWEGKNPEVINDFETCRVDVGFIEMLGIEMKEGRTFSKNFSSDSSKIIFNESAIKLMGIKNPIGKVVNQWGENKQIIGVAKDFHFESLHTKVNPLFFMLSPAGEPMKVMVKIKHGMEKQTINFIRTFYEKYNPGYVFEYKFLDEDYQAQYTSEKRVAILSKYFAGLAILISCLGLFSLAAFTAERRRKEIGIRKVLGSSELSIIYLLTNDFTKIVLASVLISFPVSYFIAKLWLNSFAYKIDLSLWYFVGAGLITLLIAWITVGVQAFKAALVNPVESLKYE